MTPILILHGSKQPYLSIGVRCGGLIAYGVEYTYLQEYDAFLQKKYLPKYKAHVRKKKTWAEFVEFVKTIKQ